MPFAVARRTASAAISDGTTRPTRWPASTKMDSYSCRMGFAIATARTSKWPAARILNRIGHLRFFNMKRNSLSQAKTQQRDAIFFLRWKFFEIENRHADSIIRNDQRGSHLCGYHWLRDFRKSVAIKLRPNQVGQAGRAVSPRSGKRSRFCSSGWRGDTPAKPNSEISKT